MSLTVTPLPYGLRDVKVATLDATGTKGTLVDLPNSQTLEFEETTSSQELRGDDTVVAKRTSVDGANWTLESGGINFEACVVMFGGTITSSGTTPAQKKVWGRLAADTYPDFFAEGQAMSESGGDFHDVLYRCKAEKMSGSHSDGDFWVTHAEGSCLPSLNATTLNKVWDKVQNETATATV
jgi:hypothetical protein